MSIPKKYVLELCKEISGEELPDFLSKIIDLAENTEKVQEFQKDYQRTFSKILANKRITECIAILGKALYDLGCDQEELSNRLCDLFSIVPEREADISPSQKEKLLMMSNDIIKSHLRIEVLCGLMGNACHESAKNMVVNHTQSGIELNLDTDPDRN